MPKKPEEWFKQADYDIKTAEIMFDNKRYIYAVFMCHLSIEKALKGLYAKEFEKEPSKTHNLIYLVEKIKLELPEDLNEFVFLLSRTSVPTRYPDDLKRILKNYDKMKTKDMLDKSREVLKWLRKKLLS